MSFLDRLLGRKKAPPTPAKTPVSPEEPPSAEETLESFVHAAPDRSAIDLAVSSLVSLGKSLKAIDLLRRISAAHGDPPDLAEKAALLLLDRGDDEAATPLLEAAAKDPKLAPGALFRLAEVHERAGRAARALECYERVIARDFDHPNARERAVRLAKSVRPPAPKAAPTLFSPEGARIQGRFQLAREVGRGGAGAVYLAKDTRLERTVALKVYHPARTGEPDPNRRLLHEARVPATIRHPGVIRILDVLPDLRAIVMEPLEGSVKSRVGELAFPEALAIAKGALEVVALLHERGIVHRDLKTSNLLLGADGRVVVTDFGVAQVGETDEETGVVGTAGYIAPEVSAGARATPAADLYALGVIFGELAPAPSPLGPIAERMRAADPAVRPTAVDVLEQLEWISP